MESRGKPKVHPTNDEGEGSRGLDTEVADRTVSSEQPAHESLHESSQTTSEPPVALAERSRSSPMNTYPQVKAEQHDENSAAAEPENGEDVPDLIEHTTSGSEFISSHQGPIVEEVDEDKDDTKRISEGTGEENEETRSEEAVEIEKRKSGSTDWDKVVAQIHPDYVREQQDHDAGNQSRREDDFASQHSEANPGDDQLGADVGDDDEAASVSTIDSKSVCLDHNDPAYDEEKAIETAKAASLATPEPKNKCVQLGRYQCPDIRRRFPSILAEFMSLPDEKKRDRKAHLDGIERKWQAQEQERRENGLWTRFGMSREHFFGIFQTRQAWTEALDAVEEWSNDFWWPEEGEEIGDDQNARRDGDLTESEKDAIEKAEMEMAIVVTLGASLEENYDPGTSGVGMATRQLLVPSPEDLERNSKRRITSDRKEDTRRRAGDGVRDAERNDARSYGGGSSSAKKYGNERDTGNADNGSGDHDEEDGNMNHEIGDDFDEEPTGTREHEDGNDNDEDDNEIVESGGEGFQDDPDSNDDFDHESTCSSFLDGVIPLTNEAVTGDVAADIEDKRLKAERLAEWKAKFEEEESISEEIPGVSEADKLENHAALFLRQPAPLALQTTTTTALPSQRLKVKAPEILRAQRAVMDLPRRIITRLLPLL